MDDKRKDYHIDPDTLKECCGFKYRRDNKIGCLSCNWETDIKRDEDKNLPDKKDLNNTWR